MRYSQVEVGQVVDLGNCRITPVPAEHTIPTVGFHLANGNASLVYCGDTTVCDPLWQAVNAIDNLKYLIIETAFDDAKLQLAERADLAVMEVVKGTMRGRSDWRAALRSPVATLEEQSPHPSRSGRSLSSVKTGRFA